jgi:hypothetical protein
MSLKLVCDCRHNWQNDQTYVLKFVKKDQLCDIYVVQNPWQNTNEVLILKGVWGIVLRGTKKKANETYLKFSMSFYDQNNKEIRNRDYEEFIVSYSEIVSISGLSEYWSPRNSKDEDLWLKELDWKVKTDYMTFDEFLPRRNINKLLIGSENFMKHFNQFSTNGNPYICLI